MNIIILVASISIILIIAGLVANLESRVIRNVSMDSKDAINKKYKIRKTVLQSMVFLGLGLLEIGRLSGTEIAVLVGINAIAWWIGFDFMLNYFRGKPLLYLGNGDEDDSVSDTLFQKFAKGGYVQQVVKWTAFVILIYNYFKV